MFIENYTGRLEDLHADLLALPVFEDERPPKDLTGVIDWQLGQQISQWMVKGHLKGETEEMVLFPLQDFAPARRLLLYGLGKKENYTLEAFKRTLTHIFQRVQSLKSIDVALRVRLPFGLTRKEWESKVWHTLLQDIACKDLLVRIIDPETVYKNIPQGPFIHADLKEELQG